MNRMRVLQAAQRDEWMGVLARSSHYDFYHLPEYQLLAERRGEGQARLFVHVDRESFVALPLLLRPVDRSLTFSEAEGASSQYLDATSAYGYVGPLTSHFELPESLVQDFQHELRNTMRDLGVVTAFSRLHPLLPQRPLLSGMGECQSPGNTVSIDLSLPVDIQRTQFRKNHKEGINKLRRLGMKSFVDEDRRYMDAFIEIYYQTMTRVQAASLYFFDRNYFDSLLAALAENFHLFVALLNGSVVAGGLFAECDGIVQYHLGGTRNEFLKLAPMKLIFDDVRLWATGRKQRVLHLGGGVGGREDSLFFFKAGFSDRRHQFSTWRWVVLPEVYEQLCEESERRNRSLDLTFVSADFFPRYRGPTVPRTKQSQL